MKFEQKIVKKQKIKNFKKSQNFQNLKFKVQTDGRCLYCRFENKKWIGIKFGSQFGSQFGIKFGSQFGLDWN